MNAVFEDAALDILDELGDLQATYQAGESPAVPLPCLVNYNTEIMGENFGTVQNVTTIEFLKSSGTNPHRGDIFHADGVDFKVESILSKGSMWIKVIVK